MKTSKLVALFALATACGTSHEASADRGPRIPPSADGPRETAFLAGGCFWGEENVLRNLPGLVSIEVGYAGGAKTSVSYEDVSGGDTGHAESVRIVWDASKISYADLLKHWYFRSHDPTSKNRQGNDVGTQYRSEIFTTTPEQQKIAEQVKAQVEASGKWKRPIVTRIEPVTTFVRAEDYHQDYLIRNPHGYNDHFMRDFDF